MKKELVPAIHTRSSKAIRSALREMVGEACISSSETMCEEAGLSGARLLSDVGPTKT